MKTPCLLLALICLLASIVEGRDQRRAAGGSATPGPDIFLKGTYIEAAVNPGGTYGSRAVNSPELNLPYSGTAVPQGFHNTRNVLGIVVDYDKNGFDVGNPPHSADIFRERFDEIGWHVSWTGTKNEIFNMMPLRGDDDDGDFTTTPSRGCTGSCFNGKIAGCRFGDCSCPATMPSNYLCPFKRWDVDSVSNEDLSSSGLYHVRYVGKAVVREFLSAFSGILENTGEEITITRDIWFREDDLFIIEKTVLENTGNAPLQNLAFLNHISPTQEALEASYFESEEDRFVYWQSSPILADGRKLVKSRGQVFNITVAIGTIDSDARGWFIDQNSWMASRGSATEGRRPYSVDWIFEDAAQRESQGFSFHEERLGIDTIALATRKQGIFDIGAKETLVSFYAFDEAAIPLAFEAITPDCNGDVNPEGKKVFDICNVCGGNGLSCLGCDGVPFSGIVYDGCGVCGGNGTSCIGCDGVQGSPKRYDRCGVCGGEDECVGCDDVPNSGLTVDRCGVCGGNDACVGCDDVPHSGKVIDRCGVCGGNDTCVGCDDVAHSRKDFDRCGVCGGSNECVGCDDVPNSGKTLDRCNVCGGNDACVGCDDIPNSGKVDDRCGVCGGNNSCVGCDDVPNSGKVIDRCNVCGGNDACVGCDNVPNSGKVLDLCNVCGGNNACVGCDGVPFSGRVIDRCGVCGGNGSSCVGCNDIPGAELDECGICLGPGKQCHEPIVKPCDDCNCQNCSQVECQCKLCSSISNVGYKLTDLDLLIYRYEVKTLTNPGLKALSDLLTHQFASLGAVTQLQIGNYLDLYTEFAECLEATNGLLRHYFGLPLQAK